MTHNEYQLLMCAIYFIGAVCCPDHKTLPKVVLHIAAAVWLFLALSHTAKS